MRPTELDAGADAAIAPMLDASPPDDGVEAGVGERDAGAEPAQDAAVGSDAAVPHDATLPLLHDYTDSSRAHVIMLVRRALSGLGFQANSPDGPNPNDRVFVGKRYLAWIDQTGFYGKVNALFTLNGASGDALDFVLVDPDGRPINLFVPGEDGDGAWASSYKGAEHIEFPNRTPEPNDKASCAQSDWCNQYALNEAPLITNDKIPWWSACNVGAMDFGAKFEPILLEERDTGLKVVYEGRLVKEADGDGDYNGDACHMDYLFPDGVRRAVYLRVGYELFADAQYIDRTLQIRNPDGNPAFTGDMSLIGGYVFTRWPNPHYQKRLHRFWRPETRDIPLDWNGAVTLRAGTWNDLSTRAPLTDKDVLVGWINQPITLSSVAGAAAGSTVTLSHIGPSDNEDVGVCLCAVHGGLEMGGGLIHAEKSLPIQGGQMTIEAKRRLTIPSSGSLHGTRLRVYEAESSLGHQVGRGEGDGWSANTGADGKGHMAHGPYATDWGGGSGQAIFTFMVDDNTYDNNPVVTLEVYDADTETIIAQRDIRRRQLKRPGVYQPFSLNFDLDGRTGHRMETRVFWHDISYVRLDSIVVKLATTP